MQLVSQNGRVKEQTRLKVCNAQYKPYRDAFAETSASFLNFHASLQDARSDRGWETKQGLRSFGVGGATTFFGGFGLRLLQK